MVAATNKAEWMYSVIISTGIFLRAPSKNQNISSTFTVYTSKTADRESFPMPYAMHAAWLPGMTECSLIGG
jgi:hypothetical protein